jgi:hypothetical protein
MTLYPSQLLQDLNQATIFLDTNVFSVATKSKDFLDLLVDLKNDASCALTTIPSVVFEVTNGSSTLEIYNERTEFISSLVDAINPMKFIDNIADFSVVMAKINANNKSYTDFLLSSCLYQYRHVKVSLLTTDLRALPPFFERAHIITTEETSGDVKNFGLYRFDEVAYTKAAANILKEAGR